MKPIAIGLLLGLAACTATEIQFDYYTDPPSGLTKDLVHVHFTDGGIAQRTIAGDDFRYEGDILIIARSDRFSTRDHGTLSAQVWLGTINDTMAAGSVEIPLREDWRWNVSIFVADSNPMKYCFGCQGSRAFKAIAGAPGDSLFLVWGGNSIFHPVVY